MLLSLVWSWSQMPQVSAAEDFDSLYSAIADANAGGESAITLTEDITLGGALPAITGSITIDGGGRSISGDGRYRIFDINGGRLGISDLSLLQGRAPNDEGGGAIRGRMGARVRIEHSTFVSNKAAKGGAIAMSDAASELIVWSSRFRENFAESSAGGILVTGASATIQRSSFVKNFAMGSAGALRATAAHVDISNSTFSENWAQHGAGALETRTRSRVTITHATFWNNLSTQGVSDVIENSDSELYLRNSIIASDGDADDCAGELAQSMGNLSLDGSSGTRASGDPMLGELIGTSAYHSPRHHSPALNNARREYCLERDQIGAPRPIGGGCDIGAIESRFARPAPDAVVPPPACPLRDQIIAANTDAPTGGCPAGRGPDTINLARDIKLSSRLPTITSDITINGNGNTISGNRLYRIFDVDGGKLTVNNLIMTRGSASSFGGGAIRLRNGAQVTVNDSSFVENTAFEGGAIAVHFVDNDYELIINGSSFVSNQAVRDGGAIALANAGKVSVSNSSFSKNFAAHSGGAIALDSWIELNVHNSAFFDNRAALAGNVLSLWSRATVTLTHVTIAGGGTDKTDHAIYLVPSRIQGIANRSTARLRNSIVDGMSLTNDCDRLIRQNVSNLIADGSCSPKVSGDPMLDEPVGDPAYVPLQAGSPAINAAHPAFCPATDQLGNPRPQGGGCDIGAFEWSAGGAAQQDPGSSSQDLSTCTVTTTHVLNFRDGPGGNVIGAVPENWSVSATALTTGWFQVDYRGATGWISADYVVSQGECG